jgi:hypothetical protein
MREKAGTTDSMAYGSRQRAQMARFTSVWPNAVFEQKRAWSSLWRG